MIHDRNTLTSTPARELALDCLQAGIEAADPARAVRERVTVADRQLKIGPAVYDLDAFDDVLVVGGGKATGRVASALSDLLADQLSGGVIVTDTATEIAGVETVVGDHPIPSERGESGARRVLERAERAGGDTLVLAVLTGGGSALLPAPAGDIALDDLQRVTDALLSAGATIDEINAVRKHCSAIKGGRLAATDTRSTHRRSDRTWTPVDEASDRRRLAPATRCSTVSRLSHSPTPGGRSTPHATWPARPATSRWCCPPAFGARLARRR